MTQASQKPQEKKSILDKAVPVEQLSYPFKGMVYGGPGVGKTTLCATAPGPFFIDVEKGAISLKNDPQFAHIPVFSPTDFKDVDDVFWALYEGQHPEYQTIILDTVSEGQMRQLSEQLKRAAKRDKNRNPYLAVQNDYKENTEFLRRIITAFCELPNRNFVVVAHDLEVKDDKEGTVYIRPAVTPKLASTLLGLMDLFGYMSLNVEFNGKETRMLQVKPSRRVWAKTRLKFNVAQLKNPTFDDILRADRLSSENEVELENQVTEILNTDTEKEQEGAA